MTKKLEKAIGQVLAGRDIHDYYELLDAIKKASNSKKGDDYIEEMLDEYLLGTGVTDIVINLDDQKVIYREELFSKTSFRIQLTEIELKEKKMVIGHRFIPYIHPTIHPKDIFLIDTEDNEILIREEMNSFMDSLIWFSLLPPYGYQHYELDDDSNINMYIYELSDWMKRNDFQEGDNIMISPIDYKKHIFRIEKISRRDLATQKIVTGNKDEKLTDTLSELLYLEDMMLPIDMQLFQAFAYLPQDFVENPGSPIGPFLSDNERLGLFNNGTYGYINSKEHYDDMMDMALDEAMFPDIGAMGTAEEIDGIFTEMGNSFSEIFIAAKFMEQLHERKEIDKDEVLDIIFKKGKAAFYNEEQEANFNKAFSALAKKIKKEKKNHPLSLPLKKLLTQTLNFKIEIIDLLREIDRRLEDPEAFDFSMLIQLQPFEILTDQLLQNILDDQDAFNPKMSANLAKQIKQMQKEFQSARHHILENL